MKRTELCLPFQGMLLCILSMMQSRNENVSFLALEKFLRWRWGSCNGAGCGSGVLGCLIAEYQSHRPSLQSQPRVDSDGQHGGLHIICAGSVVSALVAGNRIGYCGLPFRRALCRNRRRKSNVYRVARGEGPSSAYQFNACSSANSLAPNEEWILHSWLYCIRLLSHDRVSPSNFGNTVASLL